MSQAVEHLHLLDVIQGDIKPSNYVISIDCVPPLLDFELSRHLSHGATTTTTTVLQGGTVVYLALELFFGGPVCIRHPTLKATKASDVIALGEAWFK